MPGVLIIESMAQAAAVLLLQEVEGAEGKLPFLAAIESVRFRRPVVPGDQLIVEVTVLKSRSNFCQVKGIAKVNGETAAEAVLSCLMVDRDPAAAAPAPAGENGGVFASFSSSKSSSLTSTAMSTS